MPPRVRKPRGISIPGAQPGELKKITGGNSICDQEWIKAMLEDGSLHSVTKAEVPKDYYYDVIYQWDGLADEANPEFFESYRQTIGNEIPRKCNGTAYVRDQRGGYVADAEWTRITRQCIGRPARGADVCHAHGAQIPAVKAAAQRRLLEASEIVALRLIGLTGGKDENQDPVAHKDRISAANSVLDRAGIRGSTQIEVSTPGFQKVLDKMFGDEDDE